MPSPNARKRERWIKKRGLACFVCGNTMRPANQWPHPDAATAEHILPRALGGRGNAGNLAASHLRCNDARGRALNALLDGFLPLKPAAVAACVRAIGAFLSALAPAAPSPSDRSPTL